MKKRILYLLVLIQTCIIHAALSQNIAINGNGNLPDSSAMLDVSSSNKGFLAPRMTTTEQNAIPLPAKGLLIYNTTTNSFMVNTGTTGAPSWTPLTMSGGSISSLNGLTGSTQTFATGTTGTDVSINSTGTAHTFNFPDASATARGLVTTSTQTFAGNKTFSGTLTAGSLSSGASTDSIVTANSTGLLKKRMVSDVIGASVWSLTGNGSVNSGNQFFGSTNNASLRFRSNNTERMIIDSLGKVGIGTNSFDATNPEKFLVDAGTSTSVNAMYVKGTVDNYMQFNIRNLSAGTQASTDIVATANNGTETTNFIDLGINGSNYVYANGNPIETGKSNDGYLLSSGNDFYIVNNNPSKAMLFLTGGTSTANERMRIMPNGRVGMGVQDPTSQFVVKDTMEIRRTSSLSQLLFTNTAGTGDFRIGGDGGDLYWQGGGGRCLQMGSYWTTILGGDRQSSAYPSYVSSQGGTGVLIPAQRTSSVPLAVQAISSQSANLTEWRSAGGSVLSTVTKDGYFGVNNSSPNSILQVSGSLSLPITVKTNTYTATASDYTIVCNNSGAITINLPTTSGISGRVYVIKKISGMLNDVTIDGAGSQTIDGATTKVLSAAGDKVTLQTDGSNWYIVQ